MKLCQLIAVESKIKKRTLDETSDWYKKIQKTDLFLGLTRSYSPKAEDGDKLPSENKKVQLNADQCYKDFLASLKEIVDITAAKDFTNCEAKADVVVGENVLIKDAPVSYLLFLEKKLTDVQTFISKLPVLDPAETWTRDQNQSAYVCEPKETSRTKKTEIVLELAPPTDKHPRQVKTLTEDVVVGFWKALNYSGAARSDDVKRYLDRVDQLQRAVKFAREEANSIVAREPKPAEKLINFLLS